ncbi:type I-F CRISPR-associated endoribonuclease Cas6/Csy4 [Moritella sp. 24]|uniref:type I-F CRISPR-associated endoribonuclease Cas6/Csy4 n=1 Tax=Moritella sp. 24 TaxID=2746230 RepID=UPI001BA4A7B9|nr:type I-F CRISPR-associated endoribonuclease Cas6/Csy4 [Moritella sp. 24]QUM76168.1 type I-F CRISPR-associated endoribonuclease Cas6/Csy4 [Moritella sp. 24]
MNWYYINIGFLPKHCNNEVLAAKCIRELHRFNYKYDTRNIGISFPQWNQETVGGTITFVSTNRIELEFIISRQYFKEMNELKNFQISQVNEVPPNCSFALFKRNQSIDKSTAAGQTRTSMRLEKRALARGEIYNPRKLQKDVTVTKHYHSLAETSSTKQRNFRLNIQMSASSTMQGCGVFSSYGLSNGDKRFQSVPLI